MRRKNRNIFAFKGTEEDLKQIDFSKLDGTLSLSPEKKLELICQLSLFHYQFQNSTNDIPRFVRTTACIRKA